MLVARSVSRVLALTLLLNCGWAAELSEAQREAVDRLVRELGSTGHVQRDSIVAMMPDLQMKGRIGFVVLFTHEDPKGAGGFTQDQVLAIFGGPETGHRLLLSKRVGGKGYRAVALKQVAPTMITLDVLFYGTGDASCCPSLRGLTRYEFSNGTLEEGGTYIEKAP